MKHFTALVRKQQTGKETLLEMRSIKKQFPEFYQQLEAYVNDAIVAEFFNTDLRLATPKALKQLFTDLVQSLPELRQLSFKNCNLSQLPPVIVLCKKLHTLDLSNNQITFLPLELETLPCLKTLKLEGNTMEVFPLALLPIVQHPNKEKIQKLELTLRAFEKEMLSAHSFDAMAVVINHYKQKATGDEKLIEKYADMMMQRSIEHMGNTVATLSILRRVSKGFYRGTIGEIEVKAEGGNNVKYVVNQDISRYIFTMLGVTEGVPEWLSRMVGDVVFNDTCPYKDKEKAKLFEQVKGIVEGFACGNRQLPGLQR